MGKFKKNMKLILCLLLLTTYIATKDPSCESGHYCMACSATTANHCDACFNWGTGSVKARALEANTCQGALSTTAVTDCKYYSGTNDGKTQTADNCSVCNSKNYLNIITTTTVEGKNTTKTVTLTCSDTSATAATCSSPVSNC